MNDGTSRIVIESGSESIVTLIKNGQGSFVVKHRRPKGRTRYLFEAFAYRAMEEEGARVPAVISVDNNELMMTALHGETLDDQTSLYKQSDIFMEAAKDLAKARQIGFEGFGRPQLKDGCFVGEYATWSEVLNETWKQLRTSHVLSDEQKKPLMKYWQEYAPHVQLKQGMLVHGDFSLSAIFVQGKKFEGIIDFGDAFIGDPLLDLAYFRFKEITKDYGEDIYSKLLHPYILASGIKQEDIEEIVRLYMIYWAVERVHSTHLEPAILNKFLEKTELLMTFL